MIDWESLSKDLEKSLEIEGQRVPTNDAARLGRKLQNIRESVDAPPCYQGCYRVCSCN
jgi:hypothetical protein